MQNGKVVGVAFQGYSGDVAQGVAYMIPTPVIQRFLKDIEDGRYDRYVDLGMTYSKLQNPAQRRFLGLKDDDRGVLIEHRHRRRAAAKYVQSGDVLLAIDDHPIASDAYRRNRRRTCQMPEVVERKFKGEMVKLDILRNKQPLTRQDRRSVRSGLTSCRATVMMCGRVTSFMADCYFSRSRST